MMGQRMVNRGRVQTAGTKLAMTIRTQMPGGMSMEQRTVVTEDVAWTHMPMMNMVSKIDLARLRVEAPDLPLPGRAPFFDITAQLDASAVQYVGAEEIGGAATEHVRTTPQAIAFGQNQQIQMPGQPMDGVIDLWIGVADGLPRQLILSTADGTPVFTQRFTEIELDTPLPPETFAFTPPAGA